MKIEHTAIATATLLTQLLIALEKERALSPAAIDTIMRESISLNAEEADRHANLDAARFLQEIWGSVKDAR